MSSKPVMIKKHDILVKYKAFPSFMDQQLLES